MACTGSESVQERFHSLFAIRTHGYAAQAVLDHDVAKQHQGRGEDKYPDEDAYLSILERMVDPDVPWPTDLSPLNLRHPESCGDDQSGGPIYGWVFRLIRVFLLRACSRIRLLNYSLALLLDLACAYGTMQFRCVTIGIIDCYVNTCNPSLSAFVFCM